MEIQTMNGVIAGQLIVGAMQDQFTYDDQGREDDRPTRTPRGGILIGFFRGLVARNQRPAQRPRRATRGASAARA